MFHYPIGMGVSRPARMGNRPTFGSIAMSAAFTKKSPSLTFASLESHKIGALPFWWFGEHGSPRIDTSEHVFFANDQLAVRFIEESDFDYAAADATAALLAAAS